MTEHCRGCRKLIFFAISERTGQRIPLDVTPTSKGNAWISGYREAMPIVTMATKDSPVPKGHDAYISHFATCTEAARFRRPRKKGRPA